MQLIAPDIINEAHGMSAAICAIVLGVGGLLLVTGWTAHRFWIVLASTVTAGIVGLLQAPVFVAHPMVAGLLLAIAAGVLALALVRVVAFVAAGFAASFVVHSIGLASWHPMICFLGGGLMGLFLFRVWTMMLTSFAGALLLAYSGLCLADRMGKLDAVTWTSQHVSLLNIVCGIVCFGGFITQFLLERRKIYRERRKKEEEQKKSEEALRKYYDQRRWWNWVIPHRRAG